MTAVENLLAVTGSCENLHHLAMSGLGLNKPACKKFVDGLLEQMENKWGLLSQIRELRWNDDARCGPNSVAMDFLKRLAPVYNLSLQRLEMKGVFRTKANRQKAQEVLCDNYIELVLDGTWREGQNDEVSKVEYTSD